MRVLLLIFLLLSGVAKPVSGQDTDSIELVFKWYHQFEYAGVYAAKEKGFFEEEGLPVKFRTMLASGRARDYVLSEPGRYGMDDSNLLLEKDRGKNPVILCPIFQHSLGALFVYENSGIRHPHDLVGRKIISSPALFPDIVVMLRLEGIDTLSADIDRRWSMRKFNEFEGDAIYQYVIEQPSFPNPDTVFSIRPIQYGVDFYGESLYTSRREVEENIERAVAMRRAIIKGWEYALANSEEIARLIKEKYAPDEDLEYLLKQSEIVKDMMGADVVPVGHNNLSRWEYMGNQLKQVGLISEDFSTSGLFLEEYIDDVGIGVQQVFFYAGLILLLAAVVILVLYTINKRLNSQISLQTRRLSEQNQELRKMNSELDNFVYRVSHDLRSPISSSIGLLRLMKADSHEQLEEYIDRLNRSMHKLDEFIQDILDYSRNARADLDVEEVNFSEMIKEILETLQYETDQVRTELDLDECAGFYSDVYRIRLIMNNIISNSFRYADLSKKDPFIQISVEYNLDHVVITVEDNGIGIEEKYQNKVFEMFFRATIEKPGSGLGLYIVKESVERLKGNLDLESNKMEGTRFRIVLPNLKK